MKIVALIARVLLGLVFFVFGLNKFFNFIPMGPLPTGLGGQFFTVLFQSHYLWVVAAIEVIGGALLLVNRYVPLGLVLLGPVIVNIFLFHALMVPSGLPMAILVVVFWLFLAFYFRRHLSCIFVQRTEV
jgi:putative oxidoreductase